jgi:2-dehydro-3-deoxyphosphooctonate aldolase (KDO 8-P synthase)
MKELGYPVVYDVTHSMQLPSISGSSGGTKDYAKWLAFAAAASGVDGMFFEVHTNPDKALSDSAVMLDLDSFESIIPIILEHWHIYDSYEANS